MKQFSFLLGFLVIKYDIFYFLFPKGFFAIGQVENEENNLKLLAYDKKRYLYMKYLTVRKDPDQSKFPGAP